MKRSVIALAALALLITGCGRGDDGTDTAPEPTFSTPSATATPSASGSPTPTPTEETPAPDAPPVDYSAEGGALVTGSGDSSALAGAPADFSTFVTGELSRLRTEGIDGCSNDPQIRVDTVQGAGWASGGVTAPECGGYAVLWAKTSNRWAQVWSGQELVDCGTLKRYDFPVSVVGTQCLGPGGTASAYSS
ncbi:hypothetical protein [Aeromicrobium sp. CF3.5]|uniref:hypothetical protein n=1 Tax=Aeromicrobium sp. CF3.5 TaxID=3373078 RepID=UPI003EE74C7A